MTIQVHWDIEATGLDDATIEAACRAGLDYGGRPGLRVEVIVVDDPTLCDLHARFLDDPTPTDVITFDLGTDPGDPDAADGPEPGPEAEVYVSLDCAQRRASERGVTLERELALYVVHGALHLCGYDDSQPQDRARMRTAEQHVMEGLGYPPDPSPHDA